MAGAFCAASAGFSAAWPARVPSRAARSPAAARPAPGRALRYFFFAAVLAGAACFASGGIGAPQSQRATCTAPENV